MHLAHLEVSNFRALDSATLPDLPANVVIAGPNGCGKSTIFDAIRLWKSAYGGYIENEFQQWFGEFQINLDTAQPEQLRGQFRDKTRPIRIFARVTLAPEEKDYLRANASDLLRPRLWREIAPTQSRPPRSVVPASVLSLRSSGPEFEETLEREVEAVIADLDRPLFEGEFVISPDLRGTKTPSPTLQLVYSLYLPDSIGVFDYHSAQRSYNREQISNVDLRLEVAEQQQGQQALYNAAAKYQNVKTQMAANYVRDLIAEKAGVPAEQRPSIVESLRELFRLFFPDKEFLGPQPTKSGRLTFNVRTATGTEHDLNDLSSGEKEVLYGYLRLRNISPRNSVLLLDEPELHLNPKLVKGLPQFYARHLGQALANQIWLLTHSDVLLTEALDQEGFAVFHMLPAAVPSKPQLVRVAHGERLERAILSLIGEKASYDPDAALVIFEGGGDTDFDASMTLDLFPRLQQRVNTISGTSKTRVRELHTLLEKALKAKAFKAPVFSIVDRDSETGYTPRSATELQWDVYHIENYLLEPRFIHEAMKEALRTRYRLADEDEVAAALRDAAGAAIDSVVRERLERWANKNLVQCLTIGSDPHPKTMASSLRDSVRSSLERITEVAKTHLDQKSIESELEKFRMEIREDLDSGKWLANLPGRTILKRFVDTHGDGLGYEVLRNLIIARMRATGFEPPGMAKVIATIMTPRAQTR